MRVATRILTAAVLAVVCAALPAGAIDRWSASTDREFLLGVFDGTALDEEGGIGLAPRVRRLWGPESGIVWDLAVGDDGTVFVALSGPGQVIAIDADGDAVVWFDTDTESLVTALVPDGKGGLYAGLSPEGSVLHLTGPGESATLASTGSTFVWDMEPDGEGGLWIGTGIPGRIQHMKKGKDVETLYETGDDPVRSLVVSGAGIVAGTGGRGRVIRIDADGDPFVLFDADQTEIVALAGDGDAVFALAAGGPQQPSATAQAAGRAADAYVRVTAEAPPSKKDNGQEKERAKENKPTTPRPAQQRSAGGGILYRIDDEGARPIWTSTREVPFDVALVDGLLYVATGDWGRVWRLTPDGEHASSFPIASNQASALAADDAGAIWIGGTSDARVERLDTRFRETGEYLTMPIDAGAHSDWGRVAWEAALPRGTSLSISVRSGNTTEPDETWSDWVELGADGEIDSALVPRSRLLQVKLGLAASDSSAPSVSALRVSYEPRNRAPVIAGLTVEAPGVVIVPSPKPNNGNLGPLVADDPVTRGAVARALRGRAPRTPTRRGYEAGVRTFSWTGGDPDGDRLTGRLDVRREGESHWFPLVADLVHGYYSWDARSTPDGYYRVRLTVTDALDNVAGEALEQSETSELFLVDNSRPAVGDWSVDSRGAEHWVEFTAVDPGGAVAAVEVAVGDGDWRPVRPEDGVADSEVERFRLTLSETGAAGLPPSVRVRITDGSGNQGGDMRRVENP